MKRTYLIVLISLFLFIASNAKAQLWYITRGLTTDEVAWGVDVDKSGNIYWAIAEKDKYPNWYYNIFLFKLDSNAQQIWQSNPWGERYNDIGFKVTVKEPNVYVSGRTDSTLNPTSGDALVLCYNMESGNLNWQYSYNPSPDNGYEEIDGLNVQDDGIYLSGWTKGQSTDEDFLIQKISLSGQLIWTNSWDYNHLGKFDGANGHLAMDDNFIYLAGHVNLIDGSLVCFSRTDGSYQWDVTWNNSTNDEVLGLTMSSDSMLYTIGYFTDSKSGSQCCLKKFSRSGQLIWTRNWGGSGTEDSRALVTDGDSLIYVVGTTSSYGKGAKDIFVLKYDSAGTLIDSIIWGGAYDDVAKDLARYGDYLYITGETKSFGNGQIKGDHLADGLLLKVNGRTMMAPDSSMTNVNQDLNDKQNLVQIYPNPINESSKIYFKLYTKERVIIKIFDVQGNEFAKLADNEFNSGTNTFDFNPTDLTDGLYFCRLQIGDNFYQKIVILCR